ncbi:Pre-rRNA-processing protein ESF1 [Babesia microti strain RI]|uniref:Pre-rRNA-processing protein ESF1 n=1 Tax=Babesia microti (strain RI) TaxID=1133968 RepID=A0A1R4AA82_BABMR|nr:Pre-rRNA-processing protein ESF1 [Babesia microti strain RI]SJK85910.1 Pre-rRNA-processing protein ESF1 [Babesia microti strain RI]|eukprot:XP_021338119.1 Pre-rRNA-processing protein ESF1 [Babesia microti strain RI]
MDSRFNIGPSFKKHKKRKPIVEDDRFRKLKEIEKLEKYTDAIVDPFGRPISSNKSTNYVDDKFESDIEYSESDGETEDLKEGSSIWDKECDIQLGDPTDRIAVIGCDWDNINSTDIFALFQTMYKSYALEKNIEVTNVVKRASIYLSNFGKSRIHSESINGPTLLPSNFNATNTEINDEKIYTNEENCDDELCDSDKYETFRKYQLEKSRYYYAVVELCSVDVASVLYDELDGVEVGFAINSLDLRFIPPEIQFTDSPISQAIEIPAGYNPPVTNTSALRHSKVTCSWDMAPAKRTKILTRRYNYDQLNDLCIDEYIASDHSYSDVSDGKAANDNRSSDSNDSNYTSTINDTNESEDDDVSGRFRGKRKNNLNKLELSKYRELLLNTADNEDSSKYDKFGNKNGKSVEGKAGNFLISFNPRIERCKQSDSKSDYTVNDYSSSDIEENDVKQMETSSSRRSKKKMKYFKHKYDKMDVFQADLEDPRFAEVFTGENYEIDITNPNYKHTATNKSMLDKRRRKLSRA